MSVARLLAVQNELKCFCTVIGKYTSDETGIGSFPYEEATSPITLIEAGQVPSHLCRGLDIATLEPREDQLPTADIVDKVSDGHLRTHEDLPCQILAGV